MSIKTQFRSSILRAALSVSLAASAFSGTALANQCGEISQVLTAMGDSYYNVDYADRGYDWEAEQRRLLEQTDVYVQLRDEHFRSGDGERTRCFGTDDNRRMETSTFELTDISQQEKVRHSYSELTIVAFENNDTDRHLRKESIYLSSSQNSDIVVAADGKALTLNSRRRQVTEIGSYLREIAINAVLTDGGVDIYQSTYVNGYLAEWANWSLKTRK